jgi:hypothetical protein
MNKYNLRLTAQEIELLKEVLDYYEQPLTDIIEATFGRSDEGSVQTYCNSQTKLKRVSDLHTKLCYQLSDQQNLPAPLSQREYPQ